MNLRFACALLTVALATTASAQRSNTRTREVIRNIDRVVSSQCQATSTASLSHEQITGLEEVPAAIRGLLLENLPLQVTGSSEQDPCQDDAATILEARLRALCWADASVTRMRDGKADSPAAKLRLRVNLGARYQVGRIFVATDADPNTSPTRILEQVAQSALPTDRACTASTLEDMQERVSRLKMFWRVRVNPGAPDTEQKTVPVVIDVSEKAPATP